MLRKLTQVLLVASVLMFGSLGFSKDLSSRLGVGYMNDYVTFTLPSVAAIYYPSNDIGVFGSLGIDTQDDNSKFALAGGVRRIIFKEESMNFFMGGRIGIINSETAGKTDSGFELAALVGGEFFIKGLDSLGFNFDTGAGMTNVSKVRFRTLGTSFVNGGIVFYF